MRLRILSSNDAVDDRGDETQGFDAVDEAGHRGWLLERGRVRSGCRPTVARTSKLVMAHITPT